MRSRVVLGTALLVLAAAGPAAAADRARPCRAAEVKSTVGRFIDAFNEGDSGRLDRVFAGERDFQWYSTGAPGARLNEAAHDRSTLLTYFARRHAQGERLELKSLKVNGNTPPSDGMKGYGNFQLTLSRSARRLAPAPYVGKGALHCYRVKRPRIIVWSMAAERATPP